MKKLSFIIIFVFSMLLVSCSSNKNVKEKNISQLIDWKQEKIVKSYYERWCPSLVQNKQYLFYYNDDRKIIRVDKVTEEKKVIQKLSQAKDEDIGMGLSGNKLYYLYDECLYQCNLEGRELHKIISMKDVDSSTTSERAYSISAFKIYKGNIYLLLGALDVVKVDMETKKMQIVAEEVDEEVFYKKYLYYLDDTEIRRVNLETLKNERIRGVKFKRRFIKDDTVVYYNTLMVMKGKLYYTCSKGKEKMYRSEKSTVYLFDEKEKDKKIYCAKDNLATCVYDETRIAYRIVCEPDDKLIVYDIMTGREKSMTISDSYYSAELQIIGDILLYRGGNGAYYSMMKLKLE